MCEVAPVSWTSERLRSRSPRWPKTRLPYTPEFRRQMVELVNAGRSPEELAREFEPTGQSIKNWVAQAARNTGHGDGGLTTAECEELRRLRRENRQLKLEREILSTAAAWFARETNTIPPKGSGS
jgi:transposase